MDVSTGLIAVIVAKAGLPPSTLHQTVTFTRRCAEIVRTIVASDVPWESTAAGMGAAFMSAPESLVEAPAPRVDLLANAASFSEKLDGEPVKLLLHLDPTRPVADPLVIFECFQRLLINGMADGIIGVSSGGGGLVERDGWLQREAGGQLAVDGSLFMLRSRLVAERPADWLQAGRFLSYQNAMTAKPRGGMF